MTPNPLRQRRRKPFAWPKRPQVPPTPVAVPGARLSWIRKLPQLLKSVLRRQPHLVLVSSIYIFLFAMDHISLITFVSLGFFSLLFTDHMVEMGRGIYQKRKNQNSNLNSACFQQPKSTYFQQLARKQKDRPSSKV